MRRKHLTMLAGLLAVIPLMAQDSGGPNVYKVEFNIRDSSSGAAKIARRYTMLIDGSSKGNLRVGAKVPYATGSFTSGLNGVTGSTQYNFADVGVNIDTRLHELNGRISISSDIDVSSLVQFDKGVASNPPNPTIAQTRVNVNAMVELGKPALIASVDDPVTMRKFDIEVTVTKGN